MVVAATDLRVKKMHLVENQLREIFIDNVVNL